MFAIGLNLMKNGELRGLRDESAIFQRNAGAILRGRVRSTISGCSVRFMLEDMRINPLQHQVRRRLRSWLRLTISILGLFALVDATSVSFGWQQGSAPVSFNAQGEDRARRYQRPTDLLKALEISRGDSVADVGAGNGYYVQHMADLVGPTGKVYGEDIDGDAISQMNQRVKMFDLRNVEVIKGTDDDPKLPPDSLAAVLVMNAYHHFSRHEPMLEHILGSLKPGGRLVVADYSLPEHRSQLRADQLKIHEIDPQLVRAELVRAGFQVAKCEDPFLKRIPEATGNMIGKADMWLMIAVRPK